MLRKKLPITVVSKMIVGFAILGLLLIMTSGLSYLGLNAIKQSAHEVAFDKMPVQQTASQINNSVLGLAKLSTEAYYANDNDTLSTLAKEFESLEQQFSKSADTLATATANASQFDSILANSESSFSATRVLFTYKESIIEIKKQVQLVTQSALKVTDEASALMMDLSYLESDDASIEQLIGMSTNIDNKLGLMLSGIEELSFALNFQAVANIIDTLGYGLSNIVVDLDYAKRIAQNIDDEGIFAQFDQQLSTLRSALEDEAGLFALKQQQLSLLREATNQRGQVTQTIEQALQGLKELSITLNKNVFDGQQSILAAVQLNVVKSLIASIIGIVATFTLAFFATRGIAKPLQAINMRLGVLSKGDLRQTLDDSGNDEFSILAKNVNQLIYSLRSLIGSINHKADELSQVSSKSLTLGEDSLNMVAQVQTQIDITSQNTQQVKLTSMSTIAQTHKADTKLGEAIAQSKNIVSLVAQSVDQVNEQANKAQQSAQIIDRLGGNCQKIGGILEVIKTIADQTNLLALNAAIEAARAGEQGRGFAVVADEVRTLANRTQASTQEIEVMVHSLQTDSSKAVEAMNEGIEQVKKGVEITEQITLQVNEIKSIIEGLAIVNSTIVTDTNTQDTLLDDVVSRLNDIVKLNQQSAVSTRESSKASHKVGEEVEALRKAVKEFELN